MKISQFLIDIAAKGEGQAISKIRSVQDALDMADRSSARLSSGVGGLGKALRSIPGAEFFMNSIVALTTGVGIVSKMGMEAEKTATSFNVLVGSEEKAAKMLGELNKYADNTLWDRSTTQEAAKTMLGFGVSTESVVNDLKMLGDVAMGDKNKMQQLALVFGQISAAGKLQGQDLLQLINAGYNPLLDISELTGRSVAQLKEDMSKGLVTFDMVRAAFQKATGEGGKFANMTEQIAKTSYGAFEQLKGKLVSTLLQLYEIIEPYVIPALTALGKMLDFVAKMATWVAKNMDTIVPVLKVLTAATLGYQLTMGGLIGVIKVCTTVMKIFNFVMSMNPYALIVAGIAALVAAITICWQKFAGFRAVILTVWDTIKGFGNILKQYVLDRIMGIIKGIGALGQAIAKLFKGDFSGAWESAKTGAMELSGWNARQNAVASTVALAGGIRDNFNSHLDTERQKQAAKDKIKDPKAAAGTSGLLSPVSGGVPMGATAGATASAITTGGTRNTSIVLNIGKFFEDVNINNTSNQDYREIRDAVLESVNRSLEIAISAGR